MAVLGQDLSPIRDSVSGALATLRGATDAAGQASPSFASVLRSVAQPQSSGLDAGLAPLYQVGYGAQVYAGPPSSAAGGFSGNAWQTLAQAASAFGGGSGFGGLPGVNLDATQAWQGIGSYGGYLVDKQQKAFIAAQQAAADKAAQGPQTVGRNVTEKGGVGTPGTDFGAPTADVLNGELNGTALAGQGQTILDASARHGIPASVLMAIFAQESSYRTPSGANNYGGLRPADGSGGFASYPDLATGIDAVAGNLGSDLYRGLTLSQVINKWAPASDGNDPLAYTNRALDTIHRFGGTATAQSVVSGAPAATRGAVTAQGFSFPVVGFKGPVQTHWGQETGGSDLMAPEGTPVVSLGGGTVVDASPNSLGGNTVTLKLDNGLLVYMAHLRDAPLVRAGQRVNAGDPLGFVGTTGNAAGTPAHLHIGVGNSIISGGGPTGGLGEGFDAVTWLQGILDQGGGG